MSNEYYDEELEEIKRRQLEELMRKAREAKKKEEELAREAQKQAILRRILTPEARERLANVRLVRPELAKTVEEYLISLALAGQIKERITDEVLKQILAAIDSRSRRDVKIRIRGKRW
ncbi:MAG: DNA-binding protein [Desulfurococcales archaeon]|nr:DNA-binding protein [Desulfurococcales archaeon]MCD6278684.1 DNA-binding protein [Desulfurococcales archaeon]